MAVETAILSGWKQDKTDLEVVGLDGEKRKEFPEKDHKRQKEPHHPRDVNSFTTEPKERMDFSANTAAAKAGYSMAYISLGWISAAFTALLSPLFAIAGIIFGVLVNRRAAGKGNAVIVTNVVMAILNLAFWLAFGIMGPGAVW